MSVGLGGLLASLVGSNPYTSGASQYNPYYGGTSAYQSPTSVFSSLFQPQANPLDGLLQSLFPSVNSGFGASAFQSPTSGFDSLLQSLFPSVNSGFGTSAFQNPTSGFDSLLQSLLQPAYQAPPNPLEALIKSLFQSGDTGLGRSLLPGFTAKPKVTADTVSTVDFDRWYRLLAKTDGTNDPTEAFDISKNDINQRVLENKRAGASSPFTTVVKDNFDKLDTNKDGRLSQTEILAGKDSKDKLLFAPKSIEVKKDKFDSWFTLLAKADGSTDAEKNKTVSTADLDARLKETTKTGGDSPWSSYLKDNFAAVDTSKDGALSKEEIVAAKNTQGTEVFKVTE